MPVLTRARAKLPQNVSTNTTTVEPNDAVLLVDRSAQFSIRHQADSGMYAEPNDSIEPGRFSTPFMCPTPDSDCINDTPAVSSPKTGTSVSDTDSNAQNNESRGQTVDSDCQLSDDDYEPRRKMKPRKKKTKYVCPENGCGKEYDDKNDFYQHKQVHLKLKCYFRGCTYRGTFANKSNLVKHWNSQHEGETMISEKPDDYDIDRGYVRDVSVQCAFAPEIADRDAQLGPVVMDFGMQVVPEDLNGLFQP